MDQNVVTPSQPPVSQVPSPKPKHWMWVGVATAILAVVAIVFFVLKAEDAQAPANQATNGDSSKPQQEQAPEGDEEIANAIKPCTLLSERDRANFKLAEGKEEKTRLTNGCDWSVPLESPSDPNNLYIHVSVYPRYTMDQVLKQMGDTEPQSLIIGAHQAQLMAAPESSAAAGVCAVNIAIGPNKKATVRVSANGSLVEQISYAAKVEKYCGIAKDLARSIETRLPE